MQSFSWNYISWKWSVFYRWRRQEFWAGSRRERSLQQWWNPARSPGGLALTGRAGRQKPVKENEGGGAGLYFDLLGIRFQPTTEISPNDEMHLLNFKFLLPDWRLTSAQQIPIHPRLFRGAGRPRKALHSFLKLSGQRFWSCHRLLAREAATLQAWYRKWELATGG